MHAISVGNPHAVIVTDDVDSIDVGDLGKKSVNTLSFPNKPMLVFMQILNPAHIRLRVYERGCGETQACGVVRLQQQPLDGFIIISMKTSLSVYLVAI